jgi:UDP-N-acetylmuramoyl-tripeptide--D-alanyl-D-alanine ligase
MIAGMQRDWLGDAAFATAGNLNNHIGLPLTLLRLRQTHRAGVVELGMNHPGEIALLAGIAAPRVALVNNAQREHQEFISSVEAAARENGAAIEALPGDGIAVFPADDTFTPLWRRLAAGRATCTFALQGKAAVRAEAHWRDDAWSGQLHTTAGDAPFVLGMAGLHNLRNALAAAAGARANGVPLAHIAGGLNRFEPVKGRSQIRRLVWRGAALTLIDDSYNANPDSVRAAVDVLTGMAAPRWLLLGDMGEVGAQGPAFHVEVGDYARQRGIDVLWAVGPLCRHAAAAFGSGARHFDDIPALLAALDDSPLAACALVKGSRFMGMERVVQALVAKGSDAA